MIDISRLFAEKCYKCQRPIVPVDGSKVAPKLRALGHDYHPDCFKCEVKCFFDFKDVRLALLHEIFTEVRPNSRGWLLPQEQQSLLPGLL